MTGLPGLLHQKQSLARLLVAPISLGDFDPFSRHLHRDGLFLRAVSESEITAQRRPRR